MWVVKLGGSLGDADILQNWLEVLSGPGPERLVIVPGGGRFADQVRQAQQRWGFDDTTAHRMAILAMCQYGLMLIGLQPRLQGADTLEAITSLTDRSQVAVWLPHYRLLDKAGVTASWDITSDSLAAWLALALRAEHLVLIKSVTLDCSRMMAGELTASGVIDPAFERLAKQGAFSSWIYCRDRLASFALSEEGLGEYGTLLL